MSILVFIAVIFAVAMALSYWFYARKLPKKEAGEAFALHVLLWIFLSVISFFIPIMPANLIFSLFYRNPDGFVDGVHLGFSLMLWLPLINALLMLVLLPFLIKLKSRRTPTP